MFEDLKPHIVELRKRLFISVLCIVVMFGICFGFWETLLDFMTAPLKEILQGDAKMVALQVPEVFLTAVQVAFFTGLILSLPIIFWQLWLFVSPGLYDNEKKYVIPFVLSATFMFLIGAAFC